VQYDEQLTQPGVVPAILEEARRLLVPRQAFFEKPGAAPLEEARCSIAPPPTADAGWMQLGFVADQALQRREMHVAHMEAALVLMHNQLQEKDSAWQLHVAEQQAAHKEQRDLVDARRVALEAENTQRAARLHEAERKLMEQLRSVECERQAIAAEKKRLEIVSPSLRLLLLGLECAVGAPGRESGPSRPARALASLPLADLVTAEGEIGLLGTHVREEFRARLLEASTREQQRDAL